MGKIGKKTVELKGWCVLFFVLHVCSLRAKLFHDCAILIKWALWALQPHLGTLFAFGSKQRFAVNYCSALSTYWAETWIPLKKTFLGFILIFGDNFH